MANDQITQYMTEHGKVSLSPDIIRRYLVSGEPEKVTGQEIVMFLTLCKYQKLNPFLREAYLIKFGNDPATIVTGKEVFTKRAAKNPNSNGWKAGVTVQLASSDLLEREGTLVLDGEKLVAGWCEVRRKDWEQPIKAVASMKEYQRFKRDGTPMANWKSMPATMIRKVAIVQALREAFPEDLQGLYSPEEMPIDSASLPDKPVQQPIQEQPQIIDAESREVEQQ